MHAKKKLSAILSKIKSTSGKSKARVYKLLKKLDCSRVTESTGEKSNNNTHEKKQTEEEDEPLKTEINNKQNSESFVLGKKVKSESNNKKFNTLSKEFGCDGNGATSVLPSHRSERAIDRQSSHSSGGITILSKPSARYFKTIYSEESFYACGDQPGGSSIPSQFKGKTLHPQSSYLSRNTSQCSGITVLSSYCSGRTIYDPPSSRRTIDRQSSYCSGITVLSQV